MSNEGLFIAAGSMVIFTLGALAWAFGDSSSREKQVQACEHRGGVAVLQAREGYLCLKPTDVLP
jgi:hypothetical protein